MDWATLTSANRSFGVPEWIALLLYAGLVAWLTVHHQPWPDEAQAWLLARDNSFGGMLRQIHYEGSPALWHVLLWIEVRLGLSYAGMHWVSSGIGLLSAFLLLRFGRFPRWAKLSLPFSAFLLFHGPIIARSYGLSILLMLALAALYRSKPTSLVPACVVCGLLANTSLYGFAAAAGFAAVFLIRAFQARQKYAPAGLLIVCACMVMALQQTIPAPDAAFSFATDLNKNPSIRRAFSVLTGIPVNEDAVRMKQTRDDAAKVEAAQLAAAELAAGKHPENLNPIHADRFLRIKLLIHAVIFFVSSSLMLAGLFYLALLGWFVAHRALLVSLPFLLTAVAAAVLNATEHHVLMLWGALVAVLWMAWPTWKNRRRWIDPAFCLLLAAVLLEQAAWSVNVFRQDTRDYFDPGKQLAAFLQQHAFGKRIDTVTYYEVSSQPYLSHNPFQNVATSYWPWAFGKEPKDDLASVAADRPDMIVASMNTSGTVVLGNVLHKHMASAQLLYSTGVVARLKARGFTETHRFCGRQPMQFGYAEENCLIVLEPGPQLRTSNSKTEKTFTGASGSSASLQ